MQARTSCTQRKVHRVIYLRNGVRQGNPNQSAPRCGAKAKSTGQPCLGMAMRGKKRCRLHGGRSTGPKTIIGREKCGNVRLLHGGYSKLTKEIIELYKIALNKSKSPT